MSRRDDRRFQPERVDYATTLAAVWFAVVVGLIVVLTIAGLVSALWAWIS